MSRSLLRLGVLLLVLSCALAAGLYYLYRTPAAEGLIRIGEVSEIVLTVENQSTHMVKLNGVWQLSPPQNKPLDQEVIADIVLTAKSLQSRRTLSATVENLKTYELQDARSRLVLKSGNEEVHMWYGRQTFDGADRYVRVLGKPEVFLVSTERVAQVLRQTAELRDPYLFGVPAVETLEDIVLRLPGKSDLVMVRHGLFWILEDEQKKDLRFVDRAYLDQLVSALGSLSVQHFVGDPRLKRQATPTTFLFRYGGVRREMSFFRVSKLLFVALEDYPDEVFAVSEEFADQLRTEWVAENPFLMDRFSLDLVAIDHNPEASSAKTRREFHKKGAGAWVDSTGDHTLWVHNFFVYLSALTRTSPPQKTSVAAEYAVTLRMGNLQSQLDIATLTDQRVHPLSKDPVLRVRFMDRTMWVRDPGGQFVAHVFGAR
jgi:hypothetical protein